MSGATLHPQVRETGIPGFDQVLGGGLPNGNLVFIIGLPGAGKTVLALQTFSLLARQDVPSLVLTTYSESHDKLISHMRSFSFLIRR